MTFWFLQTSLLILSEPCLKFKMSRYFFSQTSGILNSTVYRRCLPFLKSFSTRFKGERIKLVIWASEIQSANTRWHWASWRWLWVSLTNTKKYFLQLKIWNDELCWKNVEQRFSVDREGQGNEKNRLHPTWYFFFPVNCGFYVVRREISTPRWLARTG